MYQPLKPQTQDVKVAARAISFRSQHAKNLRKIYMCFGTRPDVAPERRLPTVQSKAE